MTELTQSQKTALLKLPGFKDIQKQYAKENKQVGAGKKRRMKGRGFWDDVYNWFSQAGTDINQFLKDTKIVSNIASVALPVLYGLGAGLLTANPIAGVAAGVAGKSTADYIRSQGYGYVNNISKVGTKRMTGMGIGEHMGMKQGSTQLGRGVIYAQNGALVNQPKMSGGGIYDTLTLFAPLAGVALNRLDTAQKRLSGKGAITDFVKKHKLVSRGLHGIASLVPESENVNIGSTKKTLRRFANSASMAGYGTTAYNNVSTEFSNVQF